MRYLKDKEAEEAIRYLGLAAEEAKHSQCFRSRCGSVIVSDGKVIGKGFNSPPRNRTIDHCFKDGLPADFKSDKTCCVHAEQRALIDALTHHPTEVPGARIYFIRLDDDGNMMRSGDPYCTICSKMVCDAWISEFLLWHEEGVCVYETEEYNMLSFGRIPNPRHKE